MSRYFPHTDYAEDQPMARAILTTHVLTRGIPTGVFLAIGGTTARQLIPSWRSTVPLAQRLVLASSAGTIWGLALSGVALALRMRGMEEIQWKDRSWRLMENRFQLECDDWTYALMPAHAVAVAALMSRGSLPKMGWRGVVGGAGLGSVTATIGFVAWRHGLNGSKYPDNKKSERVSV